MYNPKKTFIHEEYTKYAPRFQRCQQKTFPHTSIKYTTSNAMLKFYCTH